MSLLGALLGTADGMSLGFELQNALGITVGSTLETTELGVVDGTDVCLHFGPLLGLGFFVRFGFFVDFLEDFGFLVDFLIDFGFLVEFFIDFGFLVEFLIDFGFLVDFLIDFDFFVLFPEDFEFFSVGLADGLGFWDGFRVH